MDPADAFLHRHEMRALRRKLRKERLLVVAPVHHNERAGLLAVTPARVLFSHRRALGASVQQWSRQQMAVRLERKRHGFLLLRTAKGVVRFEVTRDGDAERLQAALSGKRTATPPGQRPVVGPVATPAPDPLAHRGTAPHVKKLQDMVDQGLMTKAEMDWQLGR